VTDTSTDVFQRGAFALVQPRRGAHRAGMDALVVAAAVPSGFKGQLVDLGAGAGAVALAVLARCPQARALLVDNAPAMLACAAATLALPGNRALAERARLIEADAALSGAARAAAGLADRSADFIVMNPPFNAASDRRSPRSLRAAAHVMAPGGLAAWIRTAAALARPAAGFAAILRPEQLGQVLAALEGRFGGIELTAVHARDGDAAIRLVVRARRGSRARLALRPALVLDGADGRPTARAAAIIDGEATLFGD